MCVFTLIGCRLGSKGKTSVNFGAVLCLTGDVSSWGDDSSKGIALALDMANRSSNKYEFQVAFEDSKGNSAQAVAALKKVVSINGVVAVIGDNISGPTIAMIPTLNAAKTTMISPSASSPKLSGMSRYFFRVYPSDSAEGAFMAGTAVSRLHLRRVAILFINNDFGAGLRDVFTTTFTHEGGVIPLTMGYNENETDFRPFLTRVKAVHPDGVYLAGYYQDGGSIMKQARELGLSVQFLGSTTDEDPRLLQIAGNSAEGFLYPFSTGYDATSSDPAVVKFKQAYTAKFGKDPGLVTALAYDCTNLLIAAVETSGPDREAIRNYLANVKDYDGATGQMSFDANGDVHKVVRLKTVRNGQFVFTGESDTLGSR
jgi:branched-chain amino acid transport system substrate-binding protein